MKDILLLGCIIGIFAFVYWVMGKVDHVIERWSVNPVDGAVDARAETETLHRKGSPGLEGGKGMAVGNLRVDKGSLLW